MGSLKSGRTAAGGLRRETHATALGGDTSEHRAPEHGASFVTCGLRFREGRNPRTRLNSPAIPANLRVFGAMFIEPDDFAGSGASSRG